jgi:hypothetical protein
VQPGPGGWTVDDCGTVIFKVHKREMNRDIEKNDPSPAAKANVDAIEESSITSAIGDPAPGKISSDDSIDRSLQMLHTKWTSEQLFAAVDSIKEIAASWKGVSTTEATPDVLVLLAALLANTGMPFANITEVTSFRKFSWLNRLNILLCESELRTMELKYQNDISSLTDPGEIERLRNLLESYSTCPLLETLFR